MIDLVAALCYSISMDERRISARVPCILPLRFVLAGQSPVETLTKNVSIGGMKCLSGIKLKPLHPVSLELLLGNGRLPLVAQGMVRWVHEVPDGQQYFVGITFLGLDDDERIRLSRYLDRILSRVPA
jgi:hypothetical protein